MANLRRSHSCVDHHPKLLKVSHSNQIRQAPPLAVRIFASLSRPGEELSRRRHNMAAPASVRSRASRVTQETIDPIPCASPPPDTRDGTGRLHRAAKPSLMRVSLWLLLRGRPLRSEEREPSSSVFHFSTWPLLCNLRQEMPRFTDPPIPLNARPKHESLYFIRVSGRRLVLLPFRQLCLKLFDGRQNTLQMLRQRISQAVFRHTDRFARVA